MNTTKYPTPEQDALAAAEADLTATLDKYESDRRDHCMQMTRTVLVTHLIGHDKAPKAADTKTVLANRLARLDRHEHQASNTLTDLQRAADTEARIIAMADEASVADVDAGFFDALAELRTSDRHVDGAMVAEMAMKWEKRRTIVRNWAHVAHQMENGTTPVEALTNVVAHVTKDIVTKSRWATTKSSSQHSNEAKDAVREGEAEFIEQASWII